MRATGVTASAWRTRLLASAAVVLLSAAAPTARAQPASARLELPVPPARPVGKGYPRPATAPAGAPNILLIMTDDVGFGASSAFGGPIPTPTLDALAAAGLRYDNFHTTALCAPSRAALLTGRNHHAVGFGNVPEAATGHPGYDSLLPASAATVAEVLKGNGYSTAFFGKSHNTPDWEKDAAGPFERWPTGLGFEYFYGFNSGETNQWAPALVENTTPREPPTDDPAYILDRDLADHAIRWIRDHETAAPGKPFLIYYAPGSTHAPHQAPAAWIDRFKGRFDEGWDRMREATFARQKAAGVIPPDAELTPRPPEIPAWDRLSPQARAVAARLMEGYAGMLAYCDDQIGRVIGELRRDGELDHTLIIFIQGDNGASAEGGLTGTTNLAYKYNGGQEPIDFMFSRIPLMGGPLSYDHYPVGWAWAMNTPFQWTKQIAGFYGGTGNGMVVFWPGKIPDPGAVRGQFEHLVDVAPTLYAAAGVPPPKVVDGAPQQPLDGVSFLPTLGRPEAPSAHRRQYFEILGNLGIYEDGWIAATHPRRLPWIPLAGDAARQPPKWELYDVAHDFSQAHDVAASHPAKLAELQRTFDAEARRNHVYPIDLSLMERMARTERPYPDNGRIHFVFHGGQSRLGIGAFPPLINRSWTLKAEIEAPASGAAGVVATQGGRFMGWGLVVIGGRPTFAYKSSSLPQDLLRLTAAEPLGPGRHVLQVRFDYDGGGLGKGGAFTLSVDGRVGAAGRVAHTVPFIFNEDADVGLDTGTPVLEDYRPPYAFDGAIAQVTLDLDAPASPAASGPAPGGGGDADVDRLRPGRR